MGSIQRAAGTLTKEQNNPNEKFVMEIEMSAVPSSSKHNIFKAFIASSELHNNMKFGNNMKTAEQIKSVGKAKSVGSQLSSIAIVLKY